MTPHLRPARTLDAGGLGRLMAEAAHQPWKPRLHSGAETIAMAGQMIDHGWVTVAEDPASGHLLGFLARDGSYVHALFIAPAAQGRGIGRGLVASAQQMVARLELWTFEANLQARRFYEALGFRLTARGDGSANDEGLPDLHYLWEAPASASSEFPI
ncbi:GNAT family N-acetyltransferase [Salipiger marinus]|uniref:Acetyltransferase (GNAT) family protein n=1 Tax=Salipiger marinus TaxID=555512 RepID=A0A1G8JUL2_9RHOB|nr:GNAT family N-acetyltransferase [Salipiger marinus]SDI34909.1 Acetyltransferase (GNAT) family protein [Salipiger marinus]